MNLARHIDHTNLKPEATESDIRRLIAEAIEHRFATVCVHGRWIALVAELLAAAQVSDERTTEFPVFPCCVVGFPLGSNKPSVKALEAIAAVKDGAREIDMVIHLGSLIAGDWESVRAEIFEVVRNARAARRETLVKVILETAALTEEQTALGCRAAREAGADFVKTSTGFHPKGGATLQAVGWLVTHGQGLAVKASGGIRDRATADAMLLAGATRLGTSNGLAILSTSKTTEGY